MSNPHGTVRALALRGGKRERMIELDDARAIKGKGFAGDERAAGRRGLTLLSTERWVDVIHDLDTVLPWHTRRANVLIEGLDLSGMIGKRIRIGEVELHVCDESRPCGRMDEIHPGLRAVLKPDMRGGVCGEVLCDGLIRVGDTVALLDGS